MENEKIDTTLVVETGNGRSKYAFLNKWKHSYYENENRRNELKSPPLEVLNLLFEYNPETGSFKKKFSIQSGFINPSVEIETVGNHGYRIIGITDSYGKRAVYLLHRLAYVINTGEDISECIQVDHRNGIRTDNRFENFRLVSNKVNSRNRKMKSNNKSGYTGVSFCNTYKKWKAYVKIDGENISLGSYDSPEAAYQARLGYVGTFNLHNLGEAFSYRHTNGITPEDINQE